MAKSVKFEDIVDTTSGTVFDSSRWRDPEWLNRERTPVVRYLTPTSTRPHELPFGETPMETQLELF